MVRWIRFWGSVAFHGYIAIKEIYAYKVNNFIKKSLTLVELLVFIKSVHERHMSVNFEEVEI